MTHILTVAFITSSHCINCRGYDRFGEIARVLEASGRSIPVYSDKHLSYSFVEAEKMGFRRCICPPLDKPAAFEHMDVVEARSVVEALEAGLSPEPKEGRRRGGEDAAPMEPVADGFP